MLDNILYTVLVLTHRRLRIKSGKQPVKTYAFDVKCKHTILYSFSVQTELYYRIFQCIYRVQAVSVIVRKKPFCSYVVVYSLYAVGKLSEHLNTATFMSNDYFYNQLKGKQNCFEDKIKRLSFIKKNILFRCTNSTPIMAHITTSSMMLTNLNPLFSRMLCAKYG